MLLPEKINRNSYYAMLGKRGMLQLAQCRLVPAKKHSDAQVNLV